MSKWLFAALLVLQAHFPASYLVPLDREAQRTFGGLLRWASLSRGTRYEAAKWAWSTRSAAKSHFDIVVVTPLRSRTAGWCLLRVLGSLYTCVASSPRSFSLDAPHRHR